MDNLIRAAYNFQGSASSVEDIKQDLFVEFVNKISIWDYYGVTRESYLALADVEKREKITKYYFDMKLEVTVRIPLLLFLVCMVTVSTGRLCLRDHLATVSKDANDWILAHCFYCKSCRACSINSGLYKELSRARFWTVNKHVKWFSLVWVDDLPVLIPHKP